MLKSIKQRQIQDLQIISMEAGKGTVGFKDLPEAGKQSKSKQAAAEDTKAAEGNIYFFHADHLGTGSHITDAAGHSYQFFMNLPFGETMIEQHTGTEDYDNRWKFNGKELDTETGLYYYGARYYDPSTSIWLSVDPLADQFPSWNPYNYTMQNPLNLIDPTGMAPECPDGDCADVVADPKISDDNGGTNNNRLGGERGHKGTDVIASKGEPIYAARGGKVKVINNHNSDEYTGRRRKGIRKSPTTGLGNTVIVESIMEKDYTYTDHNGDEFTIKKGETLVMKYSHLDYGIENLNGKTIKAVEQIGVAVATGNAGIYNKIWGIKPKYRHVHVEARIGNQFGKKLNAEGFFKTKFNNHGSAISSSTSFPITYIANGQVYLLKN